MGFYKIIDFQPSKEQKSEWFKIFLIIFTTIKHRFKIWFKFEYEYDILVRNNSLKNYLKAEILSDN